MSCEKFTTCTGNKASLDFIKVGIKTRPLGLCVCAGSNISRLQVSELVLTLLAKTVETDQAGICTLPEILAVPVLFVNSQVTAL